ncbi:MAG: hypothetical protein JWM86_2044 [Thermoleophilia bacterium]|nr:hypothetical protein [Thermoleophilia bacterium]
MIVLILQQVALLATAIALLGVPGGSLVSLLRLRAALPDTLAAPAALVLGALVACAATGVQLLTESPVEVPVALHVVVSLGLLAGAVVMRRRRRARGDEVVPVARGWDRWTSLAVLVAVVFAWIVRGAIRLDGLYHVAVTRKLVALDHPNFDNVNRFVDGGPNPTYALPGWHAFVGWTGWITHLDPILAWEIMPVLVVALGALASGGLARVLLDDARATPIGALAWVLGRVLYARREVDGDAILYGAVPGQVTFELVFPVLFASIAVAMWTRDRRVLRACLAMSFACIASVIIYHANYIPYVAIVGLGYAAWWVVSGPFGAGVGKRVLIVGGAIAAMCVVCFGAVLPLLAGIDDFGETDETRIDYHLAETLGRTHIRGGHLYEMLGMPGMLAMLLVPVVAWKWRSRQAPMLGGGLVALMTMSVVPPLFELMRGTGSLTLGLRINHVVGSFLFVVLAAGILLAADAVTARGWSRRRTQLWSGAAIVVAAAAGVFIGYSRFAPEWPGYLAWLSLVVIFVIRGVGRIRGRRSDEMALVGGAGPATRAPARVQVAPMRLVIIFGIVVSVALALPVGAISARRALLGRDPFTARTHQGDLDCLGGPVERALRELPAGSMVLSDPAASFRAMALAPVYVVGDYKVWNGTDQADIKRRLSSVNRFHDDSLTDDARLDELAGEDVDYLLVDVGDGRWLEAEYQDDRSTQLLESAWARLDRFADIQAYDGAGVARLIMRNPERFRRLAVDRRATDSAFPPVKPGDVVPCNSYGLWKVTR